MPSMREPRRRRDGRRRHLRSLQGLMASSPTDTLTPKLTRYDKKVLRKVPLGFDEKTGEVPVIDR